MSANESYFRCQAIGSSSSGQRVQVFTRFKVDEVTEASNTRVIARGGGATFETRSGVAAVWDGFGGGSVLLLRWVSGSEAQIGSRVDVSAISAANTYMNLLLEVDGTDAASTVKLKFWDGASEDEPGSWTIENTLGVAALNSGSAGIGHNEGTPTTTMHEFLGIGYGEDAPRLGGALDIIGAGSAIASGVGLVSIAREIQGAGSAIAAGFGLISIAREIVGAGSAIASGGGLPLVTKNIVGAGSSAAAGFGELDISLTEISGISARIFMPSNLRID